MELLGSVVLDQPRRLRHLMMMTDTAESTHRSMNVTRCHGTCKMLLAVDRRVPDC